MAMSWERRNEIAYFILEFYRAIGQELLDKMFKAK